MAHNLETVYVGEEPWHGLGKRVHHDLTPEQMMIEAGLDWEVRKVSQASKVGKRHVRNPRNVQLVRVHKDEAIMDAWDKAGTIWLDDVGEEWNAFQNREFINFFHDFVMEGKMEMHTAGTIFDPGKHHCYTWMQAKLKNMTFEVVKDDVVESFMLFSNPFIYGRVADVRQTGVRVVCNNTLDAALSAHSQAAIKIDHRAPFDAVAVRKAIEVNALSMKDYKEKAQFLASKAIDWTDVKSYFMQVEPATTPAKVERGDMSAQAEVFVDAFEKQPGAKMGEGTWWQAFNATTYAYDHIIGKDYGSEEATRAGRLAKSWYGDVRKAKVKSMELALEFAKAA